MFNKIRILLVTAVFGLLLLAPIAPSVHAADCPAAGSGGGCSG